MCLCVCRHQQCVLGLQFLSLCPGCRETSFKSLPSTSSVSCLSRYHSYLKLFMTSINQMIKENAFNYFSSDPAHSPATPGWVAILTVHCHQHCVWSSRFSIRLLNKQHLKNLRLHSRKLCDVFKFLEDISPLIQETSLILRPNDQKSQILDPYRECH